VLTWLLEKGSICDDGGAGLGLVNGEWVIRIPHGVSNSMRLISEPLKPKKFCY